MQRVFPLNRCRPAGQRQPRAGRQRPRWPEVPRSEPAPTPPAASGLSRPGPGSRPPSPAATSLPRTHIQTLLRRCAGAGEAETPFATRRAPRGRGRGCEGPRGSSDPRPAPAGAARAASPAGAARVAEGKNFSGAHGACAGDSRMLRSGEGRRAESGARQRSAGFVQARPPFSPSLPVRVACAAVCPACPRFVLLGDGRVSNGRGGGGEGAAAVVLPVGGGTCPSARGSLRAGCRPAGVSESAGSGRRPGGGGDRRASCAGVAEA